ncbi:MAG: hypothetical protein FWE95_09340, partial [Planctomycetaceae bacterium]|nr:hypothetical protein [Planctomycetaceae bacterium]
PAEEEQNLFTRYGQRGHQYWTFDDFPMFQDWYEENTAAIDLLGEAVRKPTFFIPYVREHEKESMFDSWGSVMSVQVVREWARAAQARANYRLGIGDIDGAIDDIITIRLLGRHTGKQGTIVAGLVGIALEGMGVAVGIGSNPEFPPTKEQIERLIRELDALPPRWTVTEAIESERYFGLGVLYDFYWGTSPGMHSNIFPLMFFPNWSIDINVALARHNQLYDALVTPEAIIDVTALPSFYKGIDLITTDRSDGGRQKKRAKIRKSWNPLPLLFVRSRTNRFMDTLAAVSIPALLGSHHTWERAECFENLQRLTLALLLYEQDHGSLPDGDWRIAVKPYLGENAERYFRCPSHPDLAEDETIYAMVGGVPNASPSPTQILLVELREPQKLGEGDGRIPFEQARYGNHPNEPRPLGSVLGSNHAGGITVGVRSGVVQFISQTIHSDVWQRRLDGSAETLP